MDTNIQAYNNNLTSEDQKICELLAHIINNYLHSAESKIWHAHPVWFLDGNPVVGYSKQKKGVRLMFWSGADFEEMALLASTGKFRDASVFYNNISEIDKDDLKRWLDKSEKYNGITKNIVKRKGKLERLV
ncbi:MAG: DUF1801 domain-containing protein [Saprospiraceae bacterium]|nr:DUF1801 domain-containing protein [Saprospiraceae bacterium]